MLSIALKNGILMILIIISLHLIIIKSVLNKEEHFDANARSSVGASASIPEAKVKVADEDDELYKYLFHEKQFANVPTSSDFPEHMFRNISAYDASDEPYLSL
jgi:hypothetical protein